MKIRLKFQYLHFAAGTVQDLPEGVARAIAEANRGELLSEPVPSKMLHSAPRDKAVKSIEVK